MAIGDPDPGAWEGRRVGAAPNGGRMAKRKVKNNGRMTIMEPWREWCGNWNRYTRRRLDAGYPILQRILAERKESRGPLAQASTESLSKLIDEVKREAHAFIPPPTSPHHKTGGAKLTAGGETLIESITCSRYQTKETNSIYRRIRGFIRRTFRCGSDRSRD